jgi:NAD(P)-dependent dehydrogenase (short-subunit alcohol dehydrogenase family)
VQIKDSAFIVTGGASGLGLATARLMRERGAKVGVIDLNGPGGWDGAFASADVTDEVAVESALAALKPQVGQVRGMLNAAGGGGAGLCLGAGATLNAAGFLNGLKNNALGSFIMSTAVARWMLEGEPDTQGERGVLINVSSIVSMEGQLGTAGYAAGKGAINAMTLPLAREFARFGIRVMAIAPGIFETPMFNAGGDRLGVMNRGLRDAVQFPARPGDPPEFAGLVAHIVENAMFNGEVLRLDGAYRVPPGEPSWWNLSVG